MSLRRRAAGPLSRNPLGTERCRPRDPAAGAPPAPSRSSNSSPRSRCWASSAASRSSAPTTTPSARARAPTPARSPASTRPSAPPTSRTSPTARAPPSPRSPRSPPHSSTTNCPRAGASTAPRSPTNAARSINWSRRPTRRPRASPSTSRPRPHPRPHPAPGAARPSTASSCLWSPPPGSAGPRAAPRADEQAPRDPPPRSLHCRDHAARPRARAPSASPGSVGDADEGGTRQRERAAPRPHLLVSPLPTLPRHAAPPRRGRPRLRPPRPLVREATHDAALGLLDLPRGRLRVACMARALSAPIHPPGPQRRQSRPAGRRPRLPHAPLAPRRGAPGPRRGPRRVGDIPERPAVSPRRYR